MNKGYQKLFLHACCAPCITHPYSVLAQDYKVTIFFYNPNIQPETEYEQRLYSVKKLANKWKLDLSIGPYNTESWFEAVAGLENCKEGGKRCIECYRFRLYNTALLAKKKGFDGFATTLTLSPLKNADSINTLGLSIQQELKIDYIVSDFKKKDGFKKSCHLSKQEDLYRQNYCGCIFSRGDM